MAALCIIRKFNGRFQPGSTTLPNISANFNRTPVVGEYCFTVCANQYFTLFRVTKVEGELATIESVYEADMGVSGEGGPLIEQLTYMQDFAPMSAEEKQQVIESMVEEQTYSLLDSRDGTMYPIVKLKNGTVMMQKNLRIVGKRITSEDSDIKEGSFDIPNEQPEDFITTANDATAKHAHLQEDKGALYTWSCATAGTGDTLSTDGAEAPGSIAPKGWKLMSESEIHDLLETYEIGNNAGGSTKLRSAPLNFTFDQYIVYSTGRIYTGAEEGLVWVSTVANATQATQLDFMNGLVYTKDNPRPYGFSVRCVLR